MTKICIYRKKKDIVKFIVEDHAEYGELGTDTLCAAISTISMATLNGLTDVVKIPVGYEVRDAYIECVLSDDLSEQDRLSANILLETFYMSVKNLEEQYGEYITITELEV